MSLCVINAYRSGKKYLRLQDSQTGREAPEGRQFP